MPRHGCVFVPIITGAFVWLSAAGASQADNNIRAWEQHAARDPYDHVSPGNLGEAYLQKARESGDLEYYKKAEDALRKALTIKPGYTPAMTLLAAASNSQHKFKD